MNRRIHGATLAAASRNTLFAALAIGLVAPAESAEMWYEAGEVDKSEWECKYCEFQEGLEGEVSAGAGQVADEDFQFGNYSGYDEEGVFPVLGADLSFRGDGASYWRLDAERLWLDSRRLSFEGGIQGRITTTLDYVEIPRLISDDAQTPFTGAGTEDLQLPAGWVRAGTTGGMTALAASLQPVTLRTDRDRLSAGVAFTPGSRWTYSADFTHDEKSGIRRTGGAFLFRSTILPEPVDYTHDRVDLGIAYQGEGWNGRVAYQGSFFENGNRSLRWDNPFIEPVGNGNEGRLALEPDNEFHQLSLAGNYRFGATSQLVAKLATGLMTQDEEFLPYTVNSALAAGALPQDSLDGEVRTVSFDARLTSAPMERLTLRADVGYHDHDNRTPTASYTYVVTDVFVSGARTNRPYSYTDQDVGLAGWYRFAGGNRLGLGADYEQRDRELREVEETRETTVWAELTTEPAEIARLDLRLARADRDGSDYQQLDTTVPPQNPLLRKFTIADREQDRASARLNLTPSRRTHVGLDVGYGKSEYPDAAIGLTSSTDTTASVDASFVATKAISLHAFANWERYENELANSQNFSVPDWFATTEDLVETYGVGFTWLTMDDDLRLGIDVLRSEATGEVALQGQTGFPDLKNTLDSIEASARYRVSDSWSAELSYIYERLESDDWMLDGVEPDTIPEVLTTGIDATAYENHVIALFANYRF